MLRCRCSGHALQLSKLLDFVNWARYDGQHETRMVERVICSDSKPSVARTHQEQHHTLYWRSNNSLLLEQQFYKQEGGQCGTLSQQCGLCGQKFLYGVTHLKRFLRRCRVCQQLKDLLIHVHSYMFKEQSLLIIQANVALAWHCQQTPLRIRRSCQESPTLRCGSSDCRLVNQSSQHHTGELLQKYILSCSAASRRAQEQLARAAGRAWEQRSGAEKKVGAAPIGPWEKESIYSRGSSKGPTGLDFFYHMLYLLSGNMISIFFPMYLFSTWHR